ncbi:hypothetical protein GCM10025791_41670 [Halioxenophilus aromaticivorans]|uniref:Uncharacterized protein n=1 Tax=Halioxenophilus aromaticivorans TaxID=1306992 RepID=A0AAV3U7V5_9ALTE
MAPASGVKIALDPKRALSTIIVVIVRAALRGLTQRIDNPRAEYPGVRRYWGEHSNKEGRAHRFAKSKHEFHQTTRIILKPG